jgi:hypothetical protein
LIEEADAASDTNEPVQFADTEDGYIISFRCSDESFKKRDFKKPKSFHFSLLKEKITDNEINEAISFDKYLNILSYEEMEKLLFSIDHFSNDDTEANGDVKTEETEQTEEKPENECPYGYVFGKDSDTHSECDECDLWETCAN